jgi:transglutaminase-like putative cysteine protease
VLVPELIALVIYDHQAELLCAAYCNVMYTLKIPVSNLSLILTKRLLMCCNPIPFYLLKCRQYFEKESDKNEHGRNTVSTFIKRIRGRTAVGKLSRSRLQFIKKNINRRDDLWRSLYRPDRDASGSSCSLPVITLLTLFVSLLLLFQPTISLAKNADHQQTDKRDAIRTDRSGKDVHERIRESAQRTVDAAEKNEDVAARTDEVLKDLDDAESEDVENGKRFGEIEKKLKEIGASAALSRHREAVREYTAKSKEFKKHAGALRDAKKKKASKDVIKQRTRDLIDYLDKNTPKKEHDLKSTASRLPWRVAEPGEILLLGDASSMPGQTPAVMNTTPPVTDDLAPTIDVQITPEIRALAQSLDNQPLKIFRHVYNNYSFAPYDGSMKGSMDTYWEKEGNAYDLSSLLIALLRAANVPARYVKAKVIVPIDRVKKLVGIDDALAAVQYLASARLLIGCYTQGGVISYVLMEHVYVEAYVPYANYRGTGEDDSGKVWIPLDPGFKQLTVVQEGTDLSAAMGLDWKQFADSYFGAMRNVTPLELYREKVDQYVSANHPGKTLDELLRKTEVKTMLFDFLPNSLPYIVQEITGRFAEIPAEKRYTVRFKMFNNFEYATTLPEIAGRRITLTHAAATPEDQAVIDKFGTIFDTPPYAVKLKPQLRIDGVMRAEGTVIQGGSSLGFNVVYTDMSGNTEVLDHHVTAGSYNAVGFTIGKVRPEMASIASVEESAEPYLSKMLHSLAMKYHDTAIRTRQFLNASLKVQSRTYITEALVSTRHDIRYIWGIPISFTMAGFMIDAKEMSSGVVPVTGEDYKKVIDFMMLSGLEASYQENRTFEDSMFWVSGFSAVKGLQILKASGVTIQELEPGTFYFNPTLPKIVVDDINNALNRGWKVIVPLETRGLPVTPYIKYDPITGSAGYMIASAAGGYNFDVAPIGHELDLTPLKDFFQQVMVTLDLEIPEPPSPKLVAMGDKFAASLKTTASIGDPATWAYVRSTITLPIVIDTDRKHYSQGSEPLYSLLPGEYKYKFDGKDLLTFQVWNVAIDKNASDKHLGINTLTINADNYVNSVPYPLTIKYGITTFPNQTFDSVSMKITDIVGSEIRTIPLSSTAGQNLSVTWDGKDDFGGAIAPGEYNIVIEVSGSSGTLVSNKYVVYAYSFVRINNITTPCESEDVPVSHRCVDSFIAQRPVNNARPGDIVTVTATAVYNGMNINNSINWTCEAATGAAGGMCTPTAGTTGTGTTYAFIPNPPPAPAGRTQQLMYRIKAGVTVDNKTYEHATMMVQDNLDELRQEYEDLPERDSQERFRFDQDAPAFAGLLGPNAEPNRYQWHMLRSLNEHAVAANSNYTTTYGGNLSFTSGYRTPIGTSQLPNSTNTSNHQYGRAFDFNQGNSQNNYYGYLSVRAAGAGVDTYLQGSNGIRYFWYGQYVVGVTGPPWPAPQGVTYTQGHAAW